MKNLPQAFKLTLSTVWELLKRTFEWDSLKLIITTTAQNIGIVISPMLKAVFESIPKLLGNAVLGIISWVTYIALNIESAILGAFEMRSTRRGTRSRAPGWERSSVG